jgi:hypothetical protein
MHIHIRINSVLILIFLLNTWEQSLKTRSAFKVDVTYEMHFFFYILITRIKCQIGLYGKHKICKGIW